MEFAFDVFARFVEESFVILCLMFILAMIVAFIIDDSEEDGP